MFRNFVISQLTQASTWFGLMIVLGAIFLPSNWVIVMGLMIMITNDLKLNTFFAGMRKEIESVWPQ